MSRASDAHALEFVGQVGRCAHAVKRARPLPPRSIDRDAANPWYRLAQSKTRRKNAAHRPLARNKYQLPVHRARSPWVALSPGGRRTRSTTSNPWPQHVADGPATACSSTTGAMRPLRHRDRRRRFRIRQCGRRTLRLLSQLKALPPCRGGPPAGGCRCWCSRSNIASSARAALWRVTGGAFAPRGLTDSTRQVIRRRGTAAWQPLMRAHHFKERIAARPANRASSWRWIENVHRGHGTLAAQFAKGAACRHRREGERFELDSRSRPASSPANERPTINAIDEPRIA